MSGLAPLKLPHLFLNNGPHSFTEHLLCAWHGHALSHRGSPAQAAAKAPALPAEEIKTKSHRPQG